MHASGQQHMCCASGPQPAPVGRLAPTLHGVVPHLYTCTSQLPGAVLAPKPEMPHSPVSCGWRACVQGVWGWQECGRCQGLLSGPEGLGTVRLGCTSAGGYGAGAMHHVPAQPHRQHVV